MVSVFHNAKPNRKKGHKDYLLIYSRYDPRADKSQWFLAGMDSKEMEEERYQDALHCLKCDDVVYSLYQHDCHPCKCGACEIDGGKLYNSINGHPEDYELVKIDLLNDGIVVEPLPVVEGS